MRPVSSAFLRTVRGSHRMISEVRAVAPGQTGTDPPGLSLTVQGGDVILDGSADVRSTLDVTVDGTGLWPGLPTDPLAPYGQELFARRGIDYGNGVREWVSLGYFRIERPEQGRAPDGEIRIAARDRMAGLIEARMLAPRSFAANATFGSVLSNLVTEVYPNAQIEWDEPAVRDSFIGKQVVVEQDRFAFLRDTIVAAVGKIWYWDHRGVLVIRTPPSPNEPVVDLNSGANGVLVSMGRRLSRDGVFNAVVATGSAPDTSAPVRAVAIDNDPKSPTYWYGTFGKVPRYYSSPLLTSTNRARRAAETIMRKKLGVPYAVDLSAVPNPALEPFDPVRVIYGPARRPDIAKVEVHILDRLRIPLVASSAMTAATRVQSPDAIDFL